MDKDSDYADDTPQDYDDDEEVDNESDRPSGPPEILSKPLIIDVRPGDNVELPCHTINAGLISYTIIKMMNLNIYLSRRIGRFFKLDN